MSSARIGDSALAERLRGELEGDVLFDGFSRGRYATDASIYQIEPIGVVIPRTAHDVKITLQIAREEGVPVLPRGAGTSQGGQAVGEAIVIDASRHLDGVIAYDPEGQTVTVEPGMVLDQLNDRLRPDRLFFPVDVATGDRATIGGMTGNNSAGARSLRYGLMVDNVRGIDAVLADGADVWLAGSARGAWVSGRRPATSHPRSAALVELLETLHTRERDVMDRRVPTVLRHIAGYNLHRTAPPCENPADILVGSEGTLAFFTRIHLALQPVPPHRILGVCHFPTLRAAMGATQHIVELGPSAVELVDKTLLELAHDNPAFHGPLSRFVRGTPGALLLVEFTGEDQATDNGHLERLADVMNDLGHRDAVLSAIDPAFQQEIWSVRKAGLNIVMSMRGDRKPISFIEDCAVPLEHLPEYTERITEIFERHNTTGTWYAHASVGCLHVRPALDLKNERDVSALRSIAEEAHELVTTLHGSYSGEHGDGLIRSEFIEPILGRRIARAFEEIKDTFDPDGLFNPGKIVRPPPMDDRSNWRYKPLYGPQPLNTTLDWKPWGGLTAAAEMCNNNGACRKLHAGAMCPSYRVTKDEQHVTRGRANSLRLALTGQLGPEALTSPEMYETMSLCIGCKACRRECPTRVDMSRMKTEFLYHYHRRHGMRVRDRLAAYLPRYAPVAAGFPRAMNARNRHPYLARLGERVFGVSAQRQLPQWRRDVFDERPMPVPIREGMEVVLWVDTFNRYFEPENARAALSVLEMAGYRVHIASQPHLGRPLCCGRTFLSFGMVDQARVEARRVLKELAPYLERDLPIIGLEPSCLLTLRDEYLALLPGADMERLANHALLLEEFLAREAASGVLDLPLHGLPCDELMVHNHCHQKALDLSASVRDTLQLIPDANVTILDTGCCGMAGAFGYEAEHYDLSQRMAELDLLPAVRDAADRTWIVADGTSCRRQIADGTGREPLHVARVLQAALKRSRPSYA